MASTPSTHIQRFRCCSRSTHAAELLAVLVLAVACFPNPAQAATAARTGPPSAMTVLGDSISAGTGTAGLPSTEQKGNSWATGDNSSVNSYYLRLKAVNPAATTTNQASNGKKMSDAAGQANSMPSSTDLVLIEMGGNDLCKDTVDQMTSPSTYRSQFVSALNAIQAKNPDALTFVASIPDIYNLWFLRGAPAPPQDQVSSRAGTARTFWDTLSVIPCKSLVDNPTDMSYAANYRRWQVRDRTITFNSILKEECEKRLRCRFDDNGLFKFSSNRIAPFENAVDPFQPNLYSSYLPRAQWQFVDDDISTIDHFHPSLSGHTKLARVGWENGYDWTDQTPPEGTEPTVDVAPLTTTGIYRKKPSVTFSYGDTAGVKGIEYRVSADGTTGSWQTAIGTAVAVQPSGSGLNTFEARAMDRNGNLSASQSYQLRWDPNATAISTTATSVAAAATSYRQTTLSWTPPADDGASPITGYRVEMSTNGTTWTDALGSTATGTSATVTGLAPATAYQFRVKAINAVGTSTASNIASATTRALTAPLAPVATNALGGQSGGSLVSWSAPADDGGMPITSYTVVASPQVNGITPSCTTASTSCSVTGLVNGSSYTFSITATNAIGTSAIAEAGPATPLAVPTAPSVETATAAPGQATVTWNASSADGGLPITGYTAYAIPQGGGEAKTCTTGPSARSCTVTGLVNGTTYTFRVTASNSYGASPQSSQSNPVTPISVPYPPAVPSAVLGNDSITINWTAPGNGGSAITGYTAYATPQAGGATRSCSAAGNQTGCTITGLTNGTAYVLTVTATNAQGTSPASEPSNPVVARALPGAPTITTTSAGSGTVTVNWNPPAGATEVAVTGYTVNATRGGSPAGTACTATAETTCTVTGLTNGLTYSFTVVAINSAGSGPASSPSTAMPVGKPSAPSVTSVTRGDGSLTVTWTAPSDIGGAAISSYRASAVPSGGLPSKACATTVQSGGLLPTTCTITGLVNGQSYAITVTATNRIGTSTPGSASQPGIPATTPGATTIPVATAGNGSASVVWSAGPNGGSEITGYTVVAVPSAGGAQRSCTTSGVTNCTVTGLTNGVSYTFIVTATNAVGEGTPSAASAAVTPVAPPPVTTLTAKTATPTLTTSAVSLSTAVKTSASGKITVTATLVQGTKTVGTWTATKTLTAAGSVTVTSKSSSSVRAALKTSSGNLTVTTSFVPNTGVAPASVVEKFLLAKKS